MASGQKNQEETQRTKLKVQAEVAILGIVGKE